MKISKIEYKNFRNFRDQGAITCSTDGRITVIYGKNGVGKTTMHQLIHWVFYGKVHFNKTASDKLYNLAYENELPVNTHFDVMGRVEFEHLGEKYSLTRTNTYRKGLKETTLSKESVTLYKQGEDFDWGKIDDPERAIEKILPSGLSEYFFFDGESMIADLSVKGQDSAAKLRKALYSMFELDVLEAAIKHIGNINLKTTVIGKLFINKANDVDDEAVGAVLRNIEQAQSMISKYEEKIKASEETIRTNNEKINIISETIGAQKSKQDYEIERKKEEENLALYIKTIKKAKSGFGEKIMSVYPQLLISRIVKDTADSVHEYASKIEFPMGLNKELIGYLTERTKCICGNPIHEKEKELLNSYLDMMYPNSYDNVYSGYYHMAQRWSADFKSDYLDGYISEVLDYTRKAEEAEHRVKDLDKAQKNSPDVGDLVIERQKLERKVKTETEALDGYKQKLKDYKRYLKKQNKDFKELTEATGKNTQIDKKIEIMEKVREELEMSLSDNSRQYSRMLESNIQGLLDLMLTSKRRVKVSDSFQVTVFDNLDDESKSEGQFAVVTFAYIGGILNMLKSQDSLKNKEYPLVLDGPFSKLDYEQRQNVIDNITDFAPQVILFSKDDIRDCLPDDAIGATWTIFSNEDSNIAHVEEGFAW